MNNCIAHSRKTTRLKTLKVLFDDAKITTAFTHIYIVRQNKNSTGAKNVPRFRGHLCDFSPAHISPKSTPPPGPLDFFFALCAHFQQSAMQPQPLLELTFKSYCIRITMQESSNLESNSRTASEPVTRKKRKSLLEDTKQKLDGVSVSKSLQSVLEAGGQCCAIQCFSWLSTELVLSCRVQYLCLNTAKARAQWLAQRLEEMLDQTKQRVMYAYYVEQGNGQKRRCCGLAWEFAYGVNSKTKKRTSARMTNPKSINVAKKQRRKGETQVEMYAAAWLKRFSQTCGDQLPFGDVIKATEIRIPFGNKKMVYKAYLDYLKKDPTNVGRPCR